MARTGLDRRPRLEKRNLASVEKIIGNSKSKNFRYYLQHGNSDNKKCWILVIPDLEFELLACFLDTDI